jgi:hypothetical protein
MDDMSSFNFEATIFPGFGVKGVSIGCAMEEVEYTWGKPEEIYEFRGDPTAYRLSEQVACVFYSYFSKGIEFRFVSKKVHAIFLYSGIPGGYQTGSFGKFDGITPEGITLDSSYDQTINSYGSPEEKGGLELAPIPSKSLLYNSRGIGFYFVKDSGNMIHICVCACEQERG